MQSITVARYAVLAFTITALAVVLAGVVGLTNDLCTVKAALIVPIIATAVLLPSIVVNWKLSTQFHRLSTYNAVFGHPKLRQ